MSKAVGSKSSGLGSRARLSFGAMLAVSAVLALVLVGCGKDDDDGGGDLAGDWQFMSDEECEDGVCDIDQPGPDEKWFLSFNSSGVFTETSFDKVGNFWIESNDTIGGWSISGNTLSICEDGYDCWSVNYSVSGNTLTLSDSGQDCYNGACHSYSYKVTYVRANIASVRSSLGNVKREDPALVGTEWRKPSEEWSGYDNISFYDGYFSGDLNVYLSDYYNYYDRTWYTENSRLTLLLLECSEYETVYEHGDSWERCISTYVAETVTLDYQLANNGTNLRLRPTGSGADWDEWTRYNGMYKSKAKPDSTKGRRAAGRFKAFRR